MFHLTFETPFGEAAVIFRQEPFAILQTFLPRPERPDLVKRLKKEVKATPGFHKKAMAVSALIVDYFGGKPIVPPWEWMDMSRLTPLQQAVLTSTANIPYGQLRSYRAIAEAIGRPRAYRFVGTSLANNPYPILIPCHRVIRSDGSLGRFGGGADLKKKLIEFEAAANIS